MQRLALILLASALAGCRAPAPATAPATPARPAAPRSPLTLTYLGVAGWQLEAAGKVILLDPYFSRPDLAGPIQPDPAAIAARTPPRVDAIVIGHSHVDHVLDAPAIARATGAQLIGSASTARLARASGVPDGQIVTVRGGEDYQFDGFSIRVIPSLHSALDEKHTVGHDIVDGPRLPMGFEDYGEGGTFGYLVRLGGHEILLLSTANFIERELVGIHPDVAVVATGLRQEIYDYTCRLLGVLGQPPRVFTNHFDDWRAPPVDATPDPDVQAFVDEARACAPAVQVTIPGHFRPIVVP
ncbi:MAG: MBL fold metallo-hydrolase [Kofleriaceae bacterium]